MNSELLKRLKEMGREDFGNDDIWKPHTGEALLGELLKIERVNTKYGEKTVLHIQSIEDAKTKKVFCNIVLDRQVTDSAPRTGDIVGVKSFGLKTNYQDYGFTIMQRARVNGAGKTEDLSVPGPLPREAAPAICT